MSRPNEGGFFDSSSFQKGFPIVARGGARPGSGRKTKPTEDYQSERRAQIAAIVTPERWAEVVEQALAGAMQGNATDRHWLTPWVLGAPPAPAPPPVATDPKADRTYVFELGPFERVDADDHATEPAAPGGSAAHPEEP